MKPLLMLLSLHKQSRSLLETDVEFELGEMGERRVKRENQRKEMRVWSNSEFLGNSV